MTRGVNNPSVMACRYCGGLGYVKNPFGKARCSECEGRGWMTPDEDYRLRKRDVDNEKKREYVTSQFRQFFLIRPYETILSLSGRKKNPISRKHYISLLWWGILLGTFFIFPNVEWLLILLALVGLVFFYYAMKSKQAI